MKEEVSIFWFRRDLRLEDNTGLIHALSGPHPVLPVFIFDRAILDELPENDARVTFIFEELINLRKKLQENYQSSAALYHGEPLDVFRSFREVYTVRSVHTNRDYEPYARERDKTVADYLKQHEIPFKTYKDQVVFEKNEVLKDDGNPYLVYTPYMKKWKSLFSREDPGPVKKEKPKYDNFLKNTRLPTVSLTDMGFSRSSVRIPAYHLSPELLKEYTKTRNIPSLERGTSRLGPHLRFGTVSVRKMIAKAMEAPNDKFLNELIWREFFMQILWHFPDEHKKAMKPKYDRIRWRNNEAEFEKWKAGRTGFAMVDAGMRQLNTSGYMHNRVRMLVASFLCKHLLIDWRWGEAYFAEKLLDYEMASNVGNWQWAAGSGVDAAPYFRIFNPMTQQEKFDPDKKYIKKWIPEYDTSDYPEMMVDHKEARERCLKVYKSALD